MNRLAKNTADRQSLDDSSDNSSEEHGVSSKPNRLAASKIVHPEHQVVPCGLGNSSENFSAGQEVSPVVNSLAASTPAPPDLQVDHREQDVTSWNYSV